MPDRKPPVVDADERGTLLACLDYLRGCVVAKLAGLDDDDVACRPLVASGTSLYWLALHLTAVEIHQFQRVFAGRTNVQIVPPPPPADDRLALALGRYQDACSESRNIVDGCLVLGRRAAARDRDGDQPTLRWILTNTIQEAARHAGHLDILREQLDGSLGR